MESASDKIFIILREECGCGGTSIVKAFLDKNLATEFIENEEKKNNLYMIEEVRIEDLHYLKYRNNEHKT